LTGFAHSVVVKIARTLQSARSIQWNGCWKEQVLGDTDFFGYLQRDLVVGLARVYLEKNATIEHLDSTGYIFQTKALRTLIEFVKFRLDDSFPIVVNANI
jgi:hypothetical protein